MPEKLDIVDENGVPTGQSVPRTTAHAEGLRHRTSHVWIVRRKNGRVQVLLQMRCAAKDSYPGCYDISSAGHLPAGAEFVGSALRELREELGVTAAPADLHECGLRRFRFEAEFHGKPFKDNQVSKVFCLWLDREAEDFAVQKSEIDYVKWFDLDEAVAAVEQGQALPWDFICKILLTALPLSAGFKGGEVVPSFYIGATFGCAFGPLLGLPAGFSAAVGLVAGFCGAAKALIPSDLLAYELFGGEGRELIALGCGVCYMLSGTLGLYSSQLLVTEKLLSEYTESWGKRLHH